VAQLEFTVVSINNQTRVKAAEIAKTAAENGISPAELRSRGTELLNSAGANFPFDNKELKEMGNVFLLAADLLAAGTQPQPQDDPGVTA
jgi:hypothetical protein